MRKISTCGLLLALMVALASWSGCNKPNGEKSADKTKSADKADGFVVLDIEEIELLPGAEKQVTIKSGKPDTADVPKDSGLSAKIADGRLTVSAAKDAKEGAHLLTIKGGEAKPATLKVNLKANAASPMPKEVAPPTPTAPDKSDKSASDAKMSEDEAMTIGTEAYIYGYPLVTMDTTRRVMTNVPAPEGTKAPMGQFANIREYPTAAFKDITAPNADTLYSVAWLDLAKEPWVLHVPDEDGRYYLMPILSAWTNVFADPGTRTTGAKAGEFLITGPGWKGDVPAGMKQLKAPTNLVWVLGRTYCTGTPEDYKAVHAIQDKYSLTPLSDWGKTYTPPAKMPVDANVDMKIPPREQVNAMAAGDFFQKMATLMKDNPPADADATILAKMAKVGIVPGKPFDMATLDPAVVKGLESGAKAGLQMIKEQVPRMGKNVNGWQIAFTGDYGADYLFRAATAFVGLGANRPQDACYPMTGVDAEGKPLDGADRYVWHFASKNDMPPVNGFWSLTMYNGDYYFVANPLNRYTLSQRNKLKENADGSIDMYLQQDNPGPEKESNWLPAPKGKFNLCLRLYWPKESFLDGSWTPPAVKKTAK